MKTNFKTVIVLASSILAFFSCTNTSDQGLESGFVTPDVVQTSIYWYWISDQISEDGVVKDLQSMKAAGINRAFIGNIGLDEGIGNVKFGSDEWWRILHTALKTATELGIDIGMFNSPGWSQSGGPWVKPEQAMRYLASTSTRISGGRKTDILLEKPGKDFEDVKVIAYPAIDAKEIRLSSSKTKTGENEITVDFTTNEPFTLRSLKIYASQGINNSAKIQVKENGEYKTLAEFQIDRYNAAINVGFDPYSPVAVSVPAVTARDFRLIVSGRKDANWLKDVVLSSAPLVERYPEKTLAKMFQTPLPYWHEYQWRVQPAVDAPTLVIDPAKVLDISGLLSGDRLVWDAPEGDWVILRTGMLPTGVTNAPASPEATGLETDKMSKKHIEAHFNAYMGEIIKRIPAEDRKSWKVIVEDSYETGGQNFTDGLLEEFKTRYGYDPLPYLPAFYGTVVQSEDMSDRFLWDLRRLIADKVAYDYVGGLRDVSHQHGLTTWLENYGHWGFPGEFLQYGGQSDEIGGEFWAVGDLGDIENRAASSSAHIYGKTKVSAESFTSGGPEFSRYPAVLKQRGDRFFSEGINNSLLHVYISQPYEDKNPGVNTWFGTEFNRKNTWFSHLDLFTTYLKRVNFMLQQGLNVADVAYFIGEDAPKMTGIANPALPKGYQFDYINAEVIEKYMTVKNGLLTLPHGTQYRILVLPALETMRPELLRKIKQLIEDGAVVLGPSPKRSPSLENYPQADKEVQELAASLWSNINSGEKQAKTGKGLLIDGMDMQEAFNTINCAPDLKVAPEDPILYGHRNKGNTDIYFLTNQSEKEITIEPEFRVKGKQPELWNPVSGAIRKLPAFTQTATGTVVPMQLAPNESAFIVFRSNAGSGKSGGVAMNYPPLQTIVELSNPWTVTFDKEKRGPETPITMNQLQDLSTSEDFNIKHYSGTVVYENSFHLNETPNGTLYLALTDVSAMAKIKINGEYAGGLWTPPYRLDISNFAKKGDNTVSIEVTTTWVNRLIGDSKLPEAERKTWCPANPYRPDSQLQKSGLTGTVRITN
ncbi:hypothetical protein AGMMS49965_09220 [Bacteroidia bacterium]|nr:hypothetical protein AGMMS49965_09220 [Bacteroidia bacterium]